MTVALFRVDERLIHGQVVVGWGRTLHPKRVIVVDEALAGSPAEQEIYRSGIPAGMEIDFWTESEAIAGLPAVMEDHQPAFVLSEDLATMERLASAGVSIREINIGGIYAAAGRERVLPYVCLDPEDRRRIYRLEAMGIRVTAQDVPTAAAVRLVERAG